jgi:hypothetical protein
MQENFCVFRTEPISMGTDKVGDYKQFATEQTVNFGRFNPNIFLNVFQQKM